MAGAKSALGVYRFYRDCGFVAGGVIGGIVADLLGIPAAITVAGGLAIFSGAAAFAMLAAQVEPHEDVAVA